MLDFVTEGYQLHARIWEEYREKKEAKTFQEEVELARHAEEAEAWAQKVVAALEGIFPTEREAYVFHHPETQFGAIASPDYQWKSMTLRVLNLIRGLDKIRQDAIPQYTDLPIMDRLYVEDIDSFRKVRDVNPDMVAPVLKNGFLSRSEDQVQLALEQILGVSFHRKDWGGEVNDLYTANVVVNGARRATAFLLKGPGIGKKEMTIADCGKNGDQLVRLFTTPADLFVVQYVGPIADMLVKDVEGKIALLRGQGKETHYLVIDGQDTARVLHAYGKL
jgi:hypothetical protein